MAELIVLKDLFRTHAGRERDEFLATFPGAFLLARFQGAPPMVVHLAREEGFKIVVGSGEDCDVELAHDPTAEAEHLEIAWHTGFRGWTVRDLGSSFGTHLDGTRLEPNRPVLLADRNLIKPGGLAQLQFYTAETLYARMTQAGITRSLSRKKKRGPPGGELPAGPA